MGVLRARVSGFLAGFAVASAASLYLLQRDVWASYQVLSEQVRHNQYACTGPAPSQSGDTVQNAPSPLHTLERSLAYFLNSFRKWELKHTCDS